MPLSPARSRAGLAGPFSDPRTPGARRALPRVSSRAAMLALLVAAASSGLLGAQEPAGPDKPGAGPGAAAEASPEVKRAIEALDKAFVEIEALKASYSELGRKFQAAAPQEQLEIRKQADVIRQKGNAVLDQVALAFGALYTADAKAAIAHAKSGDVVFICYQRNRFEEAARYGVALLDAGRELPNLAMVASNSLFADCKLEKAEEILGKAQAEGELDPRGAQLLEEVKKYKELWAKEQDARAKEAKADDLPRVLLKTTRGDITIELFENEAPGAVGSFVSLVEKKFYDGIAFHRVIPGFMAQGGDPNTRDEDPTNDGQGGPGYTIPCECAEADARMHFAGSLSMAHAGKDTGGSQFFLTHLPTPHLNSVHTVFGRVVDGLQVVRALEIGDKIIEARVLRKRDHAYAPPEGAKKED